MADEDVSVTESISFEDLSDLLTRVLERHGTRSDIARIIGENCAMCEPK
jgi:hypothetical protein